MKDTQFVQERWEKAKEGKHSYAISNTPPKSIKAKTELIAQRQNELTDQVVDFFTGWMLQEQYLHHLLCQLQVTSLQETWVCQHHPAHTVVGDVITAHTFAGRGYELTPARSQRCSPHSQRRVQGHQQEHHRPSGGNCQVQACHEGTIHP